ncbi:YfgM family protein [Thalassotalea ganghwensis]
MDIHQTEEQQVETIKRIWSEYGNSIIAGLTIGLGGFIGFNFYQENKLEQELATADAYQSVVELLAEEKNEAFRSQANAFIAENKESAYAVLTALSLAKDAATHQDWSQAEQHLTTAINQSTDKAITGIAVLRKARVQLQQEKITEALATLETPIAASFAASVDEIKGDAYLMQGKKELARNAYQAAITASGDNVPSALQMKLDDLAESVSIAQ